MRAPGQMSDCPAPLTHRNRVARLAPFSPSMNATQRTALIQRIEAELKGNILPFWIKHVVDRERGGFYGEISHDLVVDRAADRGALLTSRILWTYASAYRHYRDPAHLEMAHWAYADLVKTHWDSEFGGLFWSVTADGRPKATRKQIYGLAFGTYAMSELHRATGEQEPLERAITLYRLIEQHSRDRRHGGYFEACKRDWSLEQDVRLSAIDLNEPKSQNTHLHVMEGYTNLLRVWPDPELRSAQAELLEVMLTRILDPGTHHLGLFFNETWELRYPRISYGHDIEAAWLLTEAAEVVGDPALLARVRKAAVDIAETTLREAIDSDGALLYEGDAKGVILTHKEWWPQAEAAVGFLNAYQISGDERFLTTAVGLWDFCENHLVDRKGGEWLRCVTRDRVPCTEHPKVSFWKCPYHNGRTCMELADRLRAMS